MIQVQLLSYIIFLNHQSDKQIRLKSTYNFSPQILHTVFRKIINTHIGFYGNSRTVTLVVLSQYEIARAISWLNVHHPWKVSSKSNYCLRRNAGFYPSIHLSIPLSLPTSVYPVKQTERLPSTSLPIQQMQGDDINRIADRVTYLPSSGSEGNNMLARYCLL